jgi:hypothetical protein
VEVIGDNPGSWVLVADLIAASCYTAVTIHNKIPSPDGLWRLSLDMEVTL